MNYQLVATFGKKVRQAMIFYAPDNKSASIIARAYVRSILPREKKLKKENFSLKTYSPS